MPNKDFVPQSHFFTVPAAITQTAGQEFGPDGDVFRLTTKFTLAAPAKAFSVCTGVVFIQPQTGSTDKVNVILRPYKQPIQGLNIRYIVYRGLQKSDFFTGANVKANGAGTSDFITKINTVFTEFYTNTNPPVPPFLAKYIGFDPAAQTDSTVLLDKFFFKQSEYVTANGEDVEIEETSYELPMTEVGFSLGNFSSGECGMDFVLNYGDYKLPTPNDQFVFDLAYARAADAKIDVSGISDDFQKKLKREQIYQFLDAAAYYGFHSSSDKGVVTIDNNGTKEHKKGLDIYTSVVERFVTKNRLYLYIQSDRTRSYNFYENYNIGATTNSLKIGPTETTLNEKAFANDGWPLLIDETVQTHSNTRNTLFLQLVTDNNVNTMFYGQVADVANAQKNNFIDADNLTLPPDSNGVPSELTKAIELSNPAAGPGGAKVNVAGFNYLIYQGVIFRFKSGEELDDLGDPLDVYSVPNFFDDVFDSLTATALLSTGTDTIYSHVSLQKLKLINHYFDKQQQGISAVQTAIITDGIETDEPDVVLKRVTYITETADVLNNATAVTGTITSDTKSAPAVSGTVTDKITYELPDPFYYNLKQFTDSTQTITGLELKALDGSTPNKILLGLTKEENDSLKALIGANNLTNARLFLVDLFEDGNKLISSENVLYQKYRAGIVGEKADGKLELYLPVEEVMVYSLDRKYHFSESYSKHMKEDVVESLSLDLSITV